MNMQVVTCPNCNGQVQIDASREFGFCSFCGTKILFTKDAPSNATQAFADNREAALDEITRIRKHFEPIENEFGNLDSVNDDIQYYSEKSYPAHTAFILIFIGAFILSIFFAVISYQVSEEIGDAIGWIVFSIATVAGFVFTLYRRWVSVERNNDLLEKLRQEKREISENLVTTYKNYPRCPIGIEYCRPEVLAVLYDYIRKGRAETIKEAVNLLANDEYNYEMRRIALNTQAIAQANLEANTINAVANVLR